jgi:uncharacterized membrane protein
MAAGYALGPVFRLDPARRRSFLLRTGAAVTAGFIALRATNLYGDPAAWSVQASVLATVLSFIDCEKYPPSLLYLMMTLGPALILLALFERARGALAGVVTTFGRVPFFFYVVHVALHPRACRGVRLDHRGRHRLDVWRVPLAKARELRARPPRRLRRLALRAGRALSALPRLCGAQAPAARMVVELPLRR